MKRPSFPYIALLFALAGAFYIYLNMANPYGLLFELSVVTVFVAGTTFLIGLTRSLFHSKKRKRAGLFAVISAVWLALVCVLLFDHKLLYKIAMPVKTGPITTTQWQEDISWFREQAIKIHPDLKGGNIAQRFNNDIDTLLANLENLDEQAIKFELMKILASNKEGGHTLVFPMQPALDADIMPIIIQSLDDGFVITDAGHHLSAMKGAEILAINDTPIETVAKKLSVYYQMANPNANYNLLFPGFIANLALLHHAGITDLPNAAQVTFRCKTCLESEIKSEVVKGDLWEKWLALYMLKDEEKSNHPLTTKYMPTNYWLEWLPEKKTLIFNYTQIRNNTEGPNVIRFTKTLEEALNQYDVERFVIDLRRNQGGIGGVNLPLVEMLASHPKLQDDGNFYALVSKNTYSAAASLVGLLENMTSVILVGQDIGQGVNHVGDPKVLFLPNSGLAMQLAHKPRRGYFDAEKDTTITPHIYVPYTVRDFQNNQDPVLDYVFSNKPNVQTPAKLPEEINGKYIFAKRFSAEIKRNSQGNTELILSDGLPFGMQRARLTLHSGTDNKFETSSQHYSISLSRSGLLTLNSGGTQFPLQRVADTYLLPAELLTKTDRINEGIEKIRSTKWYDDLYDEVEINNAGYNWYAAGEYEKAMQTHGIGVALFPNSANIHDSFGETSLVNGKKELAIQAYTKALELNPNMQSAIDALAKLNN